MDVAAIVVLSVISLWMGSVEWRMRNMDNLLRKVPSRQEVTTEIQVRQESIKVLQQEIKEDIKEMKQALIKLAEK